MKIAILFMELSGLYTAIVVTVVSTPRAVLAQDPTPPQKPPGVPGVRDVMEGAAWLSQQTLAVWFAILTILFGGVIYLIIRHLLKTIDSQRESHTLAIKEQREEFHKLQVEEKQLSLSLLQYLEKDHAQTVVLVKENQSIMQETVSLLRSIQQDRHDEKLLREKNHEMLTKIDKATTVSTQ